MKKLFTLAIAAGIAFSLQAQQPETYSRVHIPLGAQTYAKLQQLGLAVDHVHVRGNVMEAELSATELQLMRANGIDFSIEIADLSKFYAERAAKDLAGMGTNERNQPCGQPSPTDTVQVPANFTLGSMGGFFTYQEMLDHLDNMATLYPNLITVKAPIAGHQTIEGRPIYWVKLSDNPTTDESAAEPQVLYDAVHHAREPMSMSNTIFYMYYLLENYATNPAVQQVVNNMELFFVPCINPDGYIYNHSTNPNGGGMWRKNRRNNGDGTMGVDLNRNYGYNWGFDNAGSSPNTAAETYRGTAGFSEPETQAMKAFCEAHNFKNALNFHSFSNVLIYPFGHAPDAYTPDSARFVEWAQLLTQDNHFGYGTTPQVLGYFGNGDSDAWMYGEQTTKNKIYSFTPEIGSQDDGFWPQPSRIIPLAQGMVSHNLHMAMLAQEMIVAESAQNAFVSSLTPVFHFSIRNLGLQTGGPITASLQSSNPNVIAVGAPVTFTSIPDLIETPINISFTLNNTIPENTEIPLQVVITQGSRTWTYNFTRTYFTASPTYSHNFGNTQNLTMGNWGLTTANYITAPSSVTDSPNGNYAPNSTNTLQLNQNIDLTNAQEAFIRFHTRWDIEADWDYAQVIAQSASQTKALCGRYTREAISFAQPAGQPIYDGQQLEWVEEKMSLEDFLGQQVSLRVSLTADQFAEFDGMYIDDLEVFALTVNGLSDDQNSHGFLLSQSYPNPASGKASVAYELPAGTQGAQLIVTDVLGRRLLSQSLAEDKGIAELNISQLPAGTYCYLLTAGAQKTAAKRMVIIK